MAAATGDSTDTTGTTSAPQNTHTSDFVRDLCTTNGGDLDLEALRRLTGKDA